KMLRKDRTAVGMNDVTASTRRRRRILWNRILFCVIKYKTGHRIRHGTRKGGADESKFSA
ncbi:MAG: hypothetical protein PUB98_00440, partial [Clostridiales bacterium]|nr:hypothetical protein [Clostridiales bacterium]